MTCGFNKLQLAPWLSLKSEYLMLSLLIPCPASPSNNIDIYLNILIDDLKDLWSDRLESYDKYRDQTFQMRAALTWTYFMLSG